jgi:hypothetical protein
MCVKRGWEHCWKEFWVRGNDGEVSSYCSWQWYHHYVQWTEQCGELALSQHSVNVILINCLWWHDSPVKSTQLVDYVVRTEWKLFFMWIYFAESKECEEWDIANCVFVISGCKCWLLCQVMYRTTYCSCKCLAVHMSVLYSVTWTHALECVYVHHAIFQCSHTIIRWTCRLFCSRALKWIKYSVRVRVVWCKNFHTYFYMLLFNSYTIFSFNALLEDNLQADIMVWVYCNMQQHTHMYQFIYS